MIREQIRRGFNLVIEVLLISSFSDTPSGSWLGSFNLVIEVLLISSAKIVQCVPEEYVGVSIS